MRFTISLEEETCYEAGRVRTDDVFYTG